MSLARFPPWTMLVLGSAWIAACARPRPAVVDAVRPVNAARAVDAVRSGVEITLLQELGSAERADMLGCPRIAAGRGDRVYQLNRQPVNIDVDGYWILYSRVSLRAVTDGALTAWMREYDPFSPCASDDSRLPGRVSAMGAGPQFRGVVVAGCDTTACGTCGAGSLARYDENGNRLFMRVLSPPEAIPNGRVWPLNVIVDRTDRIYVLSSIWLDGGSGREGDSHVADSIEAWSSHGARLFQREIDPGFPRGERRDDRKMPAYKGARAVAGDNGLVAVLSGYAVDPGASPTQIVHFDERGNERWRFTWSARGPGPALAMDGEGNTYAAGFVDDELSPWRGSPHGAFSLARIDHSGHLVWSRPVTKTSTQNPIVLGLAAEQDGRLWVAGVFDRGLDLGPPWSLVGHPAVKGVPPLTPFLARFSPSGATEWAAVVGGPFDGLLAGTQISLAASPSGGIVAAIPYQDPLLLPGLTREASPDGPGFGCVVARLSAPDGNGQ